MCKRFWVFLMALLLPLCALGEAMTLTATGASEVEGTETAVLLRFELSVEEESMEGVQASLDGIVESLREILSANGIEGDAVRFTEGSVRAVNEYHYTKLTEKATVAGYAASGRMEVRVEQPQKTDEIINALHLSGIAESYELVPVTGATQEARDAALASAAREAMRSAEVLAQASGCELDQLYHIEEDVQEGTATVSVTYTLK